MTDARAAPLTLTSRQTLRGGSYRGCDGGFQRLVATLYSGQADSDSLAVGGLAFGALFGASPAD